MQGLHGFHFLGEVIVQAVCKHHIDILMGCMQDLPLLKAWRLQERKAAEKVKRDGKAVEMASYDKGSMFLNLLMSKKERKESPSHQVSHPTDDYAGELQKASNVCPTKPLQLDAPQQPQKEEDVVPAIFLYSLHGRSFHVSPVPFDSAVPFCQGSESGCVLMKGGGGNRLARNSVLDRAQLDDYASRVMALDDEGESFVQKMHRLFTEAGK